MTRLLDLARGRWPYALALLFLLVLAVPGSLAAQDSSRGLSLTPADDLSPTEPVTSKPSCPAYGVLSAESRACAPRMAFADLTTGVPLQLAKADADLPFVRETSESNPRLAAALIPLTAWGLVAANSLVGYHDHSFHINDEDWFHSNTRDGGADKASHFADYFIVRLVRQPDPGYAAAAGE